MNYVAKAAQYKKDEVTKLTELMEKYPIICILNVENLPAAPLSVLRRKLRKDVVIKMSKKQLIQRAIDNLKDRKELDKLKNNIARMPALLLTKENPFKVAKLIKASKSKAPAKAGQTAPYDLMINAGPTQFTPGPIISELGQAGLKTGVEEGKIVIKEDKIVARQGDIIDQKLADLLAKFDIQPMEIGLDLVAAYEDGIIYGKDVLSVDPEEYVAMLRSAAAQSFGLTLEIGYPTKENIDRLLANTFNTAKNFALDNNIISDVWIEKQIENAERAAKLIVEKSGIDLSASSEEKANDSNKNKDKNAEESSENSQEQKTGTENSSQSAEQESRRRE